MGACRHDISTKTEFSRKRSTYIVIPCRPARVQLHVKLPLLPGQLVVLGLFFSGQGMPLRGTWDRNRKTQKHHNLHQGEKRDSVLGGGGAGYKSIHPDMVEGADTDSLLGPGTNMDTHRKHICSLCPSVHCCIHDRKVQGVAIPNAVQMHNGLDRWEPYRDSK